jgi:hypothetical protein
MVSILREDVVILNVHWCNRPKLSGCFLGTQKRLDYSVAIRPSAKENHSVFGLGCGGRLSLLSFESSLLECREVALFATDYPSCMYCEEVEIVFWCTVGLLTRPPG